MFYRGFSSVVLMLSLCALAKAEKLNRPDILWLVTDDQRWDSVSAYKASPLAETPQIDALAEEGVLFTHAFVNSQVCAPSRHSFLSGRYPHQNGIYNFDQNFEDVPFHRPYVTQILKEHGYQVGTFGKLGTHIIDLEDGTRYWPSYDASVSLGEIRGYGLAAYNTGANKWFPHPEGSTPDEAYDLLRAYSRKRAMKVLVLGGYNPRKEGQHEEDAMVYLMNNWLERFVENDKPVMAYIGTNFPHTPILPPRSYAEKWEARLADSGIVLPKGDPDAIALYGPQMKEVYESTTTDGLKPEDHAKYVAHYYADCAYGDRILGNAIDAFKASAKRRGRDWLIIYHSDHGYHIGEHGFGAKWTFRDESVRVPLVVASSNKDRFPAGGVNGDLVELVDIVPTLLSAAGIDLEGHCYDYLAGNDLSKVVRGEADKREFALTQIGHWWGHRAGIRNKEWSFSMRVRPEKYVPNQNIDWAFKAEPQALEIELFDLTADPDESENVAYSANYEAIVEDLKSKLLGRVFGKDRVEYDWIKPVVAKGWKGWWGRRLKSIHDGFQFRVSDAGKVENMWFK